MESEKKENYTYIMTNYTVTFSKNLSRYELLFNDVWSLLNMFFQNAVLSNCDIFLYPPATINNLSIHLSDKATK